MSVNPPLSGTSKRTRRLRILEELFSFKLWLSTSSCVQKKFAY
eukprot:COSAG05_NODE_7043_length_863_cov_1.206806_1_plen_42_part_10